MKTVLVLGAGQSSPFLIHYLLEHAADGGYRVIVADRDLALAEARGGGPGPGDARAIDGSPPEGLAAARAGATAEFVPRRADLADRLAELARPGDVVLLLGAGDITLTADELAPLLGGRG